jgi:hypothetical protein
MSKKFIVIKCGKSRRVYLQDIAKVYTLNQRKTPKLPKMCDCTDTDSELRVGK